MSSECPDLQWNLNEITQCWLLTFKTDMNTKIAINLLDFSNIYKLIQTLNRVKSIMKNHQTLVKKCC